MTPWRNARTNDEVQFVSDSFEYDYSLKKADGALEILDLSMDDFILNNYY